MKEKLMCLFLSFSSAFTSVDPLNVCSSKKRRKNNQVQELNTKIFVGLNPSNYLEFFSTVSGQLQPPLYELAFLGRYFITKKFFRLFFLPNIVLFSQKM